MSYKSSDIDMRYAQQHSPEHVQYMRRNRRMRTVVVVLRVSILIGIFVLWEVAARLGG